MRLLDNTPVDASTSRVFANDVYLTDDPPSQPLRVDLAEAYMGQELNPVEKRKLMAFLLETLGDKAFFALDPKQVAA